MFQVTGGKVFGKVATLFSTTFILLSILQGSAFALESEDPDDFIRMYLDEDEMVESATRMAKPASQIPENVTVITSAQIEAMGVHTVGEALERVPGLFMSFSSRDFGSLSHLSIQGSQSRHVLVMVDEIPWNWLAGGNASTITIPVGIIDRIEVIRGPASSTWGSALGGVVNIITKEAGKQTTPHGAISATYGKKDSLDGRAELAGKGGELGYYLFAGKQRSDGLRNDREFDNAQFFAKVEHPLMESWSIGAEAGYSSPEADLGDLGDFGVIAQNEVESFFWRTHLKGDFSREISAQLALFGLSNKLKIENDENGIFAPAGDLFKDIEFDEDTYGASAQLAWGIPAGVLVLGADYLKGDLDQTTANGDFLQSLGAAPLQLNKSDTEKVGIYTNGTFLLGPWTLVPGLRYDVRTELDPFWSPSFGLTRNIGKETLIRALMSRGFTDPGLAELAGGGTFIDPNPSLDPEEVWSYQLGLETSFPNYAWLRGTLFRHKLEKAHEVTTSPSTFNDIVVNSGEVRRTGLELEVESAQFHNFSVFAGSAFVRERHDVEVRDRDIYTVDLALRYSSPGFLIVDLSGHHIWWDISNDPSEGEYDDFIWDLSLTHTRKVGGYPLEVLIKVHNLFNGKQYDSVVLPNPERWAEAGLRLRF